jgi:hypothetical protein
MRAVEPVLMIERPGDITMHRSSCLVVLILAAVGCAKPEIPEAVPVPWHRVDLKDLDAAGQAQLKRAEDARDALLTRLTERIGEVMATEGPAAAILVCRREAPQMAEALGKERRVFLGATSFALRNPNNKPPEWAQPILAERPEQTVVLKREDGYLGVLMPASLDEGCTACHGSAEQVPEAVRKTLTEYYPQDEALGMDTGELRGWFWAVVDTAPAPALS